MSVHQPTSSRREFAIAACGAVTATAGFRVAGSAQDATPAALVEHFDVTGRVHRFTIGDFACLAISDGSSINTEPHDLMNFYSLIFGASPPEDVDAAFDTSGYDVDRLVRQDTCVLVNTGDQFVLIDTGIGAAFGGALLSNLDGVGVSPEDIDVVITTHCHPDHIGGNVDDSGALAFPNARYVIGEEEWNFWSDDSNVEQNVPNAQLVEMLLGFVHAQVTSIAERYERIPADAEILPGISVIDSRGHTPGHLSVLVESGDEKLLIGGDFATHPVVMQVPSLAGFADMDAGDMEATRRRLFQRIADEGGAALFSHFDPFPGLGAVAAHGETWRWEAISASE
jgi:glyoxylase-like metal-dependent hydrolase (beta-lactamase superfamily II)